MLPLKSALPRPTLSAVSAFGIPHRHRSESRAGLPGWLGAGAHGMVELGLFTFQNKVGLRNGHLQLAGWRSVERREPDAS